LNGSVGIVMYMRTRMQDSFADPPDGEHAAWRTRRQAGDGRGTARRTDAALFSSQALGDDDAAAC
jgi:hypothetical protein